MKPVKNIAHCYGFLSLIGNFDLYEFPLSSG